MTPFNVTSLALQDWSIVWQQDTSSPRLSNWDDESTLGASYFRRSDLNSLITFHLL